MFLLFLEHPDFTPARAEARLYIFRLRMLIKSPEMLTLHFNPRKISDYLFHILLPILAVILPLVFLSLDIPIMPLITTTSERLFTVFGFCMWCVLLIAAYREIKARPGISLEQGIIILLPLLVSFFFLVTIVEYGSKSFDYEVYEYAFQAILRHKNPYVGSFYFYPPLFAQGMAFIYAAGRRLLNPETMSELVFVFYIHQCIQFLLCNVAYQLSSRFATRLGFSDLKNKLIVGGLFLFNFPLIRMLHLNQINLYVLITTLIALLALNGSPFLSGAAAAFGGLIKLYPLIMGAPLLVMKKWKALLGAFVTGGVVIAIQTNFGRDLTLWIQFFRFFISFPTERESEIWIRNTTLLSLAHNLHRFTGLPESLVRPFYIITALIALVWITVRLFQREKTFPTLPPGPSAEAYRNFGNLIDFASISLLITPSAWDHHFVIAIPLALWAIALRGKDRPGWVGIATASIFVLPPFDIFPFSYLRMFGVIVLLILTAPNFMLKSSE